MVAPNTQLPVVVNWVQPSETAIKQVTPDQPLPVTMLGTAFASGLSTKYVSCTASTNATVVKASAGSIRQVKAFNNGSVPVWLKLYNKATTPNPAADTVFDKYEIPAGTGGAGFVCDIDLGQWFDTGISFAVTANFGDTDNTAVSASVVSVTVLYL